MRYSLKRAPIWVIRGINFWAVSFDLIQLRIAMLRQTLPTTIVVSIGLISLAGFFVIAQIPDSVRIWQDRGTQGFRRSVRPNRRPTRMPSRTEFPTWDLNEGFEDDVFTFVRIQYDSFGPFGWWDRWDNDYPDGDWNFSFRLKNLTALKVAPDSKVLRLTDPELFDFPFIYMAGVQTMTLSQQEQTALRRYLQNGGFLMLDDYWAFNGHQNVMRQMRAVLPDCEPEELTLQHPIFNLVYELKELPQVTDLKTWRDGFDFEYLHGDPEGDTAPHFWGFFDAQGRLVAVACHNNDIGDGWEREGEDKEYFRQFSERWSYPLGINIVTYAMTH